MDERLTISVLLLTLYLFRSVNCDRVLLPGDDDPMMPDFEPGQPLNYHQRLHHGHNGLGGHFSGSNPIAPPDASSTLPPPDDESLMREIVDQTRPKTDDENIDALNELETWSTSSTTRAPGQSTPQNGGQIDTSVDGHGSVTGEHIHTQEDGHVSDHKITSQDHSEPDQKTSQETAQEGETGHPKGGTDDRDSRTDHIASEHREEGDDDENEEIPDFNDIEEFQDDVNWDEQRAQNRGDTYGIGAGIADITGPAANIHTLGFGTSGPETGGIHTRLFSRAFVIVDEAGNRFAYVTADLAMIDTAVKHEVLRILKDKYEEMYHEGNVMLTPTHTHSGPGGYLQYVLYTINTYGFIKQNFDVISSGIARSIDRAHENIQQGRIFWNEGIVDRTTINRSPTAYYNNPADELNRYEHDTDKGMFLLRFEDLEGKPIGLLNWHACHATSMNSSNNLISSDNKGYAATKFEREMNPGSRTGTGPFIAAFSTANHGDASPNVAGPRCIDTGEKCDRVSSTCNGRSQLCIAFGPGSNIFESTRIIGHRQYAGAKDLFQMAHEPVRGPIGFTYHRVNMSWHEFNLPDGTTARTCSPAMGYSFAAGTIDGPGAFDFRQGSLHGNPFWDLVRNMIKAPTPEMVNCQKPKPILFAVGEIDYPYPWVAHIVPMQIIKLGNVLITGLPSEFTTMAGRRVRDTVLQEFTQQLSQEDAKNLGEIKVALAGLANIYTSYVTTPEEYEIQRYEGASTLYGKNTLNAYLEKFKMLAQNLAANKETEWGPEIPNYLHKQISLKPGVFYDGVPTGHAVGDVVEEPRLKYYPGEQAWAAFWSANPRNDLKTESTYMKVERKDEDGVWREVATDSDWNTYFFWQPTNPLFGQSKATCLWDIPLDTQPGFYRIKHFGVRRTMLQQLISFESTSRTFEVLPEETRHS